MSNVEGSDAQDVLTKSSSTPAMRRSQTPCQTGCQDFVSVNFLIAGSSVHASRGARGRSGSRSAPFPSRDRYARCWAPVDRCGRKPDFGPYAESVFVLIAPAMSELLDDAQTPPAERHVIGDLHSWAIV